MTSDEIDLPDGRIMPRAEWAERVALLSKPFGVDEIEKLPKQVRKDDPDKGKCERGTRYSGDGYFCGGWHARSMHLDYVGHAGITDRLNQVDPMWTWEPMALTPNGTPLMSDGGMWGKLTVLGVTRIGYGDPGGKAGPNAIKETIGDFLRNAAMRFGVGTYLWSKSEAAAAKKIAEEEHGEESQAPPQSQPAGPDWQQLFFETGGDKLKLEALRNHGNRAGAPEQLFTEISKALAALAETEPIEGNVVP